MLTATFEGMLFFDISESAKIRPYQPLLIILFISRLNKIRIDKLNVLLLLYIAGGFPSLLNSVSLSDSLRKLFFELIMICIAWTVRACMQSEDWMRRGLRFWGIIVPNVANGFALIQFFTWMMGSPISPHFAPTLNPLYRPYSFFIEPNFYGNFLVLQICLLTGLMISHSTWTPKGSKSALWLAIVMLLLNQSRASWIGALAAMFLMYRLLKAVTPHRRLRLRPAQIALWFVAGVLCLVLLLPGDQVLNLRERAEQTINPLEEGAAADRLFDILLSIELLNREPVLGIGVGTYGLQEGAFGYSPDRINEGGDVRTSPRNIFLAWLVEKGIIGFGCGMAFVIIFGKTIYRRLREAPVEYKKLITALAGAWFGIFISFQATMLEISPSYWITIGMLLGAMDLSRREQSTG
jgi:O-antigen ligase